MMITRVTSGVVNVNRLFTKVNKNWKFKKFDYTLVSKKCTPLGVFNKVLNSKNNFLVKVKFIKK